MSKIVSIDTAKCIGCGACADMCPEKILTVNSESNKCEVSNEHQCDRMKHCEYACFYDAIHIAS